MNIELYIEGEKKTFTVPFVPMLAKRKYLEIQADIEKREETPTAQEILEEDDAMYSILPDIIFEGKFTLDQLYKGVSSEYAKEKLAEAVYGIKPKKSKEKKEEDEGNQTGE
ncbi:phage tail assembly chaperone G [Virgibacillus ndiopensis]|uniref:phage tail assembly chaperone G n=1 Tax=Virgibacillus ndiopensis TaxID=2004408 RepID=UPI000C06DD94|nr:hypothetical protein [Virgibacillus ndiopensis]